MVRMMTASEIEDGVYLSDIDHAKNDPIHDLYDIVITCCWGEFEEIDNDQVSHQSFDLQDRSVHQQDLFDQAVDATRKAITVHDDKETLVHCIAGQSRSPAVLTTAIAARDDQSFDAVRDDVYEARPQIWIHPELRKHGRRYLGEFTYEEQ
jgi:protein-tyrosine phosphatase